MALFKKNKEKIFCVSLQRTGTTSVGEFYRRFGYDVATWYVSRENKWAYFWEKGDFESIFNSKDFQSHQVFEDGPWWAPEFYKVLFHRFPNSKFVLLERDENQWFRSMVDHSGGKVLGNTKLHSKLYRREDEFYKEMDKNGITDYDTYAIDNILSLEGQDEHYKKLYRLRNREIIDFFKSNAPQSFFNCQLEDPLKWQKLGRFMNIDVPDNFELHANKTKK